MKTFRKWMLLIHRYLGFGLSLLFVVWFLSGFVMMYASYPTMKQHQRLQQLPTLNLSQCRILPDEAVQRAGITDTLKTIRLGMLLNRPIYRMVTQQNKHLAIFADTGDRLPRVDTALGSRIALAGARPALGASRQRLGSGRAARLRRRERHPPARIRPRSLRRPPRRLRAPVGSVSDDAR